MKFYIVYIASRGLFWYLVTQELTKDIKPLHR